METLFVIPARGGSKGIPNKNLKSLNEKPLIQYSIEAARDLVGDDQICLSTDSDEIKKFAETMGLHVPFLRPSSLASDTSGMYEVLLHSISYYEEQGIHFENLVLLQPTSPFRKVKHIEEALGLYKNGIDMVASVKETDSNPYFKMYIENSAGNLEKLMKGAFVTRQEAPKVWELNGAIFIYNIQSLKRQPPSKFEKILKYPMDTISSVDLDTPMDWSFAEFLIKNNDLI